MANSDISFSSTLVTHREFLRVRELSNIHAHESFLNDDFMRSSCVCIIWGTWRENQLDLNIFPIHVPKTRLTVRPALGVSFTFAFETYIFICASVSYFNVQYL